MKIVSLDINNILRLTAVHINPDGSVVILGGQNGEGKTSVLDSIEMTLAGASSHPDRPIHDDEEKGTVEIDLGDMIVTRTFRDSGSTNLVVESKEGAVFKSPQKMLDELTGKIAFDPIKFATMDDKARTETLRELVGIDFSVQDGKRQKLYTERTEVNREATMLKGQIDALKEFKHEQAVNVPELMKEFEAAQEHNTGYEETVKSIEVVEDGLASFKKDLANTLAMLESIKNNIKRLSDSRVDLKFQLEKHTVIEVEPIRDKIANAENINRYIERKDLAEAKEKEARVLTSSIKKIDTEKAEKLSSIIFPIDGLSLGDDGVIFNGLPFNQASSAEQLRVAVAMGIAMNPKLKVLLIRDGSLLDDDSLAMVAGMAEEADAQVWIERVGEGAECQVIIQDGQVKP